MNVFNLISAGGGKSEGLYIWKKYEYTPAQNVVNPSFTLTYTSTTKATISNANFDYMALPQIFGNTHIANNSTDEMKTVCDFYDGFKSTLSNTYKFVVNTINKLELFYQGASTYLYGINDGVVTTASSMNYWTTLDFVYNGTKTLPAKIGDFIDYVISDKEDAYPDKEVKDGFYYEKFSEMDFGDMNITRISVGEITPASATTSMTITHNLGVSPKFAYVWTDDTLINQYSIYKYACSFRSPQYLGICALWNMGNSIANTAITQNYTVNSFYIGDIYVSGTYASFEAGKKYKFVVLA